MFTVDQTIKINRKNFIISRVNSLFNNVSLIGTLEGDPSFLKGKRTVFASQLVKTANGYTYNFLAK